MASEEQYLNKMSFQDYLKICKSPLLISDNEHVILSKIKYPDFFNSWLTQKKLSWLYEEVAMSDDKKDWSTKLNKDEKKILELLFLFFTQLDVEVNKVYTHKYLNIFKPLELQQMLLAFADMEVMHTHAYNYLVVSIFGQEEAEKRSSEFLNFKEIRKKYEFLQGHEVNTIEDLFLLLIIFGAFTEGVMLYASFAIFLFFPGVKKVLNGTGQIVSWSMRDESLHVQSMAILFQKLKQENPLVNIDALEPKVHEHANKVLELEFSFIDMLFEDIHIEGINAHMIKEYIKYKTDYRLRQFGFKLLFHIEKNPLKWMDAIGLVERANFFEVQATEYSSWKSKESIDSMPNEEWNSMFNNNK